ncbi:MAG: peptidylprolyl isomerase [Candidatus Verstraetearchaeota archaeon]|nr:peptidylprolyl isomerase [Candidatus Verstraetearchaeota archaeon]
MPMNKGDFVLVNYTVKVKDTDEIVDTTIEDVAKKGNIYQKDKIYEPLLLILGEGQLFKKVEEEIMLMQPGEKKTIELKPEDAFGQRDPAKVKIISAKELTSRGITPKPGIRVETDEGIAIVRSVGGGRVVIDLNHPLAGKTLVYEVDVVKKIEDLKDKMLSLIHRRIPSIDISKFTVEINEGRIRIIIPEDAYLLEGLQYMKRGIVNDVQRFIKDVSKVEFIEVYEVKQKETTT